MCDAFLSEGGRTFRCTNPLARTTHALHVGIAGQATKAWLDNARGAMGQVNPLAASSNLNAQVGGFDSVRPTPGPPKPAPVTSIPSVGPGKHPYPDTHDLAVPGSAVPPVENQDVSLVGATTSVPQKPYVTLPKHDDGPGYGDGEMPDEYVLHPPLH